MTENLWLKRKTGDGLIAMARRIFKEPQYARSFTVLAISQIANTKGITESMKVEIHAPGNPKAADTKHISLIGYSEANRDRWEIMLHAEAKNTAKKMRMVKSREKETRDHREAYEGQPAKI